jgi:dephospho-CoA kinase
MGAYVCDSDALYHELLETDTQMLSEINSRFPSAFSCGKLDRKALGRLVFADKEALDTLNAVTHRHVMAARYERLADFAVKGGELAALDAIALIESGSAELCDYVIGITAPREDRIKRLRLRENMDEAYLSRRIDAQKGDDFFRERCDYIIENDGDETDFIKNCRELFSRLLE